jgi:uncharacterized membrane protein
MKIRYLLFIPIWFIICVAVLFALWFLSAWIFANTTPLLAFLWGPFNFDPSHNEGLGFVMGRFIGIMIGSMLTGMYYEGTAKWIDGLFKEKK